MQVTYTLIDRNGRTSIPAQVRQFLQLKTGDGIIWQISSAEEKTISISSEYQLHLMVSAESLANEWNTRDGEIAFSQL